jgi:hypothetical protein
LNRIQHQLKAALSDLLEQLKGIGVYSPGEDDGQWAGTEGLSFRKATEALSSAEHKTSSFDDGSDIAPTTVWSYRKHPERRYVVLGVANVAHKHTEHPPIVVYRSLDNLGRLWTRPVSSFREAFSAIGASLETSSDWNTGDGDWNESLDVYSAGIDIGKWSSKIECHAGDQREAEQLRDLVISSVHLAERAVAIKVEAWHSDDAVRIISLPDGTSCDVFPSDRADEMKWGDMEQFLARLTVELSARAGLSGPGQTAKPRGGKTG